MSTTQTPEQRRAAAKLTAMLESRSNAQLVEMLGQLESEDSPEHRLIRARVMDLLEARENLGPLLDRLYEDSYWTGTGLEAINLARAGRSAVTEAIAAAHALENAVRDALNL
jgi:hypothetical protein